PGNERVHGSCPEASIEDLDRAIAAACEAFDHGPWPRLSFDERAEILLKAAEIFQRRAPDFSASWIVEMGCAISLAGPGGFSPFGIFSYYGNMIKGRTFEEVRKQS